MKLSIYTYLRNGLYFDYHVVAMLRHHLALADEIVVFEGYSTDGTYQAIRDLDPKIKIMRGSWNGVAAGPSWWGELSDRARQACRGEWCLKLDCDEFIPEWEFPRLGALLDATDEDVLPIRFDNFYANYKVLHANPARARWIQWKWCLHRNRPDVHAVGDGSSVRVGDRPWKEPIPADAIGLHHFGAVRKAARLREKWRRDGGLKAAAPFFSKMPGKLFDLWPHKWLDPEYLPDLAIYEGPYVAAVAADPAEFTRDDMQVYEYLRRREAVAS